MVLAPAFLPFEVGEVGDVQWMNSYGWPILALIGVITLSLYLWSYLSKHFEIWKAHEGRYFDSEVLDSSRRMALIFIISLLAISTYAVVSLVLKWTENPDWPGITTNVFKAFAIVIIFLVAQLLVLVLSRIARRSRANAGSHKAMPSAMEFTTLLLSYIIYIGSIVLVLLIAISMFMSLDKLFSDLAQFLSANESNIIVTVAIIVGIYLAIKVEETILEDVKFRSKKFNPHVVDLMSSAIRYSLIIIGFLIVLFNIFLILGMETVGVLLVVVTLIFICLGIALSYSTIQNVVSGIALMDTSPFEVGDRIRIVEGMMCDVIEKGLVFTKVKTMDGEIVDVPNNEILQGRIYNYSRAPNHAINVPIRVSFEVPHEKVESFIKEAISDIEGIVKEPKPTIRAEEIQGPNILYDIIVYTKDVEKDPTVRSQIITRVQEVFQTEGHKVILS
ncbi:MAG: mechanosensitive ion channel family protein [Methanomassiliicoccus sp.]|nr:mechanosensitive ion channel family protein [Methanomassiliicoccus sp.]